MNQLADCTSNATWSSYILRYQLSSFLFAFRIKDCNLQLSELQPNNHYPNSPFCRHKNSPDEQIRSSMSCCNVPATRYFIVLDSTKCTSNHLSLPAHYEAWFCVVSSAKFCDD